MDGAVLSLINVDMRYYNVVPLCEVNHAIHCLKKHNI